jgi:hypothetical protein
MLPFLCPFLSGGPLWVLDVHPNRNSNFPYKLTTEKSKKETRRDASAVNRTRGPTTLHLAR